MLKMYLNKDYTQYVEISSFSRELDIPDPDVRFNLSLSFTDGYSAEGIEYLMDFANEDITDIEIKNSNDTVLLSSIGAAGRLISLMETCDENSRNAWGTIKVYEVGVTPAPIPNMPV